MSKSNAGFSVLLFEARLTKPKVPKETLIAPTGGNIIPIFDRDMWKDGGKMDH